MILILFLNNNTQKLNGDWGLGIGDWGLGIWKQLILKNNNNKHLKLFKCPKDKIIFFDDYYENNYLGFCPICKKYICYYCLYSYNIKNHKVICCLKRLINVVLFVNGPKFKREKNICGILSILLLIPGINILLIGIFLAIIMDENVAKENLKKENILEPSLISARVAFLELFALFALVICYFLLSTYFVLGLILISLPFKLIPLKYYFGIIDAKEEFF